MKDKRILIVLFLLISAEIFGQRLPVDTTDYTTTTTNAQYGILFDNGPPKKAYVMTMEYFQPMIFGSGIVRPRSIATNMLIGATTNTFSDKLYVYGTMRSFSHTYIMGKAYIGAGSTAYLIANPSTHQLSLYDPITGIKTLAQLAAGGGSIDLSTVNNHSILFEDGDSANGSSNLYWLGNTLRLYCATNDTGLYIENNTNTGNGILMNVGGAGSANGIKLNLTAPTGYATHTTIAASAGGGAYYDNSSTAFTGVYVRNKSGSIRGISSYSESGGGVPLTLWNYSSSNTFEVYNSASMVFRIKGDSTFLSKYAGNSHAWVKLTSTGAFDTANYENAGFMLSLTLFLPITKYMQDVKLINGNNELVWNYVEDKTKLIKSQYGLKKLSQTEVTNALMAGIERSLRYINTLENDNKIQNIKIDTLETELRKTQDDLNSFKQEFREQINVINKKLVK